MLPLRLYHSGEEDVLPVQEDHQARFYADYRKVSEEYDKEFMDKYDEDLNTTLIFAGLFSAVASAFIIEVDSHLQPDSGDETAALLRVLIYKIDNTTFGNDVPSLPQWTGPPPTIVHVQAILFTSLAISLLAAFLAMLGKQWLNRYVSTNMRGSPIDRSQSRQRKLDGIVAWYFNHVMESLPMMMQAALLLLGFALSRYLWDIDVTVASVIIGITSFGVFFFLFIVVAGAISESCPYQTPGSQVLRYLAPKFWSKISSTPSFIISARSATASFIISVPSAISSLIQSSFRQSRVVETVTQNAEVYKRWWSRNEIVPFLRDTVLKVPLGLAVDFYRVGRATIRGLFAIPLGTYNLLRRGDRGLFYSIYSTIKRRLGQHTAALDLRCISWTLQKSLDKSVHLSTLKHLGTVTDLTGFDPILVPNCFNVFVGCVSFSNRKLKILQGLEQLATVSVECFFRTLHHLADTDPNSGTLTDLRRRYDRFFPFDTDFRGLPFYHTMKKIHALAEKQWNPRNSQWDDYRPPNEEYIPFARSMLEAAHVEYQQTQRRRVPRWILRFALHSLSLDPPSTASVVADSLTIVAIELDCDVSNITTLDERCVQIWWISTFLTEDQYAGGDGLKPRHSEAQNHGRGP
ncbi:hypothetical protein BJ322DRAFT_291827 [Thelephora terrestris]|uniref:DUF6535 domain-containing protein n=1 Tax=Thelephora terrestris TaxID=56493 RepID=A0A9P6H690_9AGAM|nr:hypothetical protein BJ322DRAFT_291827 [Thelephora terrestris]